MNLPSTGDGGVEINSLVERVDLNGSLGGGGQSSLCSFTSSSQPTERSLVLLGIFLVLSLELSEEELDHSVVKVLSSQMSVSSSRFDLR